MARLEMGPTFQQERDRAEAAIDAATRNALIHRAFYTAKIVEARRVLSGDRSLSIEQEASLRGIDALELAQMIEALALEDERQELERIAKKLRIRAAGSRSEIVAILAESEA